MENAIVRYYVNQAGSGVGHVYAGTSYQKGHGLGAILGGLFRFILPLFKRGAATVGQEAARAGSHILADIASGGVPLPESLRQHTREAGQNLKRKLGDVLTGSGIKRKCTARARQIKRGSRTVRTKKRNVTTTAARDVFST